MSYDYRCYNQHEVLKPHWGFWLTSVFLSRHLLSFLLLTFSGSGLGGRGGVGRDAIELGGLVALIHPIYMLADIPALIVLFTLGGRTPQAGRGARAIWRKGRALFLSSIAIYFALFLANSNVDPGQFSGTTWTILGLNAAAAIFIVKSRYLADLFSQFPEAR